jgi:hypothetical protein
MKQGQSRRWIVHATAPLRDCPPKFGLDHGLIWLMLGYRLSRRRRLPSHCRFRFLAQHLRAGGCVKVGLVFVSATDSYCDLLKKIWIEQRGAASETYYRITEKGLTAKMALLRIYD